MTLYAILLYAVTTSSALGDSERMTLQLQRVNRVFEAPAVHAPLNEDIYQTYTRLTSVIESKKANGESR